MQAAIKSQINTLLYLFPFFTQGFCEIFVADSGAMECLSLLNTFPQAQETPWTVPAVGNPNTKNYTGLRTRRSRNSVNTFPDYRIEPHNAVTFLNY